MLGSANLYDYVQAQPLSAKDPSGLASVSIDGYYGGGGGIVIGRNPDGKWFISFRIGVGMGGGVSYDPNGSGAGADSCACKWNSALGFYATTQAGFLPAFVGNGVGGGMVMNPGCGGPTGYLDAQPLNWGLDAGIRLRLNASAGLEVTLY